MALLRGYIAASLDGYIADRENSVGWLAPYEQHDYGYDAFVANISTIVMGRGSFDFAADLDEWPYQGRRSVVLTSRPLHQLPDETEVWSGPVGALINELRGVPAGDVWVMGGGQVLSRFATEGGLDRLELFVIPVLLGGGVPLWQGSGQPQNLILEKAEAMAGGVARLVYSFAGHV